MNRRSFLQAIAATSLAAFLPAIEAAAEPEPPTMEGILSGAVPLYITLVSSGGEMIQRQRANLHGSNSFGIKKPCAITSAILSTEDGSLMWLVTFKRSSYHCMTGDTFNILDVKEAVK